jgi:hypothetical protein
LKRKGLLEQRPHLLRIAKSIPRLGGQVFIRDLIR